ncbi:Beta-glucan synthesis-associated protein, partial [Globisporangium polare]
MTATAVAVLALASTLGLQWLGVHATEFETKSGIRTWVDPATPEDRQVYTSSRGD